MVKLTGLLMVLLVASSAAYAKPHKTTMLGTDRALECDFTSNGWCERADLPDIQISTTRASTRMCLKGDGTWQTVPANTPCIGRYGLASFGAGTNYLPNSTNFSGYTGNVEGELVDLGGYWGATSAVSQAYRRIGTSLSITEGETVITTCEVRGSGSVRIESLAGSFSPEHTLTSEWRRVSSVAYTAPGSTVVRPYLYVSAGSTINVRQCQIEKATVPGPRHDCEAAPCSWQADVHLVPDLSAWPVEAGEVRLQYTPLNASSENSRWLIDGSIFNSNGWELYVHSTNALRFFSHRSGANSLYSSPALAWVGCDPTNTTCVPYDIRVVWGGGELRMWRDGTLVYENLSADMPVGPLTTPAASVGIRRLQASNTSAYGHIRLLRISK